MSAGDQAAGAREAARASSTRSATRTSGATTATLAIERDDFARQRRARATRSSRTAQLAKIGKPVDRGEWRHDAADRQRLLRPADERHQLPRGRAAAAVLRPEDGRRAQLRQHRRHHRPRADPRLRRRGPPVRRQGQPARLVDEGRRQGSSTSAPQCVVDQYAQLRRGRRHQDQRQAHAGRGHRRPGRPHPRVRSPGRTRPTATTLDSRVDGLTPEQRFFVGYRAVGLRERAPREPARAAR